MKIRRRKALKASRYSQYQTWEDIERVFKWKRSLKISEAFKRWLAKFNSQWAESSLVSQKTTDVG